MILPYVWRLLCLCFASFFVLSAACSVLVRFLSKPAVRFAESTPAAGAARLLFLLRLLPCAVAVVFVLGLCVPSYLWLEPSTTSERVGPICIISGILGVICWLLSVVRAARAMLYARSCDKQWNSAARASGGNGERPSLLIVDSGPPILAVSGLVRRRFIISRNVVDSLSEEELESALSHERAHLTYNDNLKRLVLLLIPDIFPFFRTLRVLEENWSRFTEWAADDFAAQGDSVRAVSLASALVRVARLGVSPRLPPLSTSLLACNRDLSVRVDRLLRIGKGDAGVNPRVWKVVRQPSYVLGAGLGFGLLCVAILSPVHQLLEHFLH